MDQFGYWKDIKQGSSAWARHAPELAQLDQQAQTEWLQRYAILRAEYDAVGANTGNNLRLSEFLRYEVLPASWAAKRREIVDVARLGMRLWDILHNEDQPVTGQGPLVVNALFTDVIRDNRQGERMLAQMLARSPRPEIQLLGAGHLRLSELRNLPLKMRLPAFDSGELFEIASLRGRVVLVDIWSNHCSACISAMPRIQKLYEKHRMHGFEVVGLWLASDLAVEKSRAEQIIARQGASWRQLILAGPDRDEFKAKYGVVGVPLFWLLDREGRLQVVSSDLVAIEQRLTEMLSKSLRR